jgi:predicted ArsR family transcriptional regulator
MAQPDLDQRLAALASLGDPLRRELYSCVTGRDGGVGRDEAAAAVGVSRALAAYHLDKLVDAGLLDTRFERRTGRRGLGAGRTAKLYLRSATPVEVALPARDFELIAGLLAYAVEADPSGGSRAALQRAARATVRSLLAERGYEPYEDSGVLRLRNCPFGRLAETHRELVCHANLAFMEGLLQGHRRGGPRAVLEPRPGRCCVAFV